MGSESAYLLAHGSDKIPVHSTNGGYGSFGFIFATQLELVPPTGTERGVRNDFDYLKNVGLDYASDAYIKRKISLTAPFTAKSSPRLIEVPTAMNSFEPVSVLVDSRGMIATEVTNSLLANSYLRESVSE